MDGNISLADIASVVNGDGFGGANGMWVLILLFFLGFGGGGFFGNRTNNDAMQQEILYNQQFQGLNQAINKVGDGLSSLGYAQQSQMNGIQTNLGNAIVAEGRTTQQGLCELKTAIHDEGEQTRALIQTNKIEELQAQINELKTANMMCGLPRINPYMYGIAPYANCGCGQQNI